jgi:digalactosyldiacylglycerol synthase
VRKGYKFISAVIISAFSNSVSFSRFVVSYTLFSCAYVVIQKNSTNHLFNELFSIALGFCRKICSSLQRWNSANLSASGDTETSEDIAMLLTEARKAAKELDVRIATVLYNFDYEFRGDVWGRNAFLEGGREHDKRSITIVTTASLPWMTGTAINPLLRAAYLVRNKDVNVTLLVPWLSKKDQILVYPNQTTFNAPQDQERYIRKCLNSRLSFQPEFDIIFYPGKVIVTLFFVLQEMTGKI